MKKLFILFALLVLSIMAYAQNNYMQNNVLHETFVNDGYTIDTLYYDKDWKGVQDGAFSTYHRIILTSNNNEYPNKFRDYFVTGELQAEGGFISIDRFDDSKSVFDGECINYSKTGRILEKRTFVNGTPEGDYYVYHESNGLVHRHVRYSNGRINGVYSEFSEDGKTCYQLEYINDNPQHFYTISTPDGYSAKFNVADNTPFLEQPSVDERKTEYRNGEAWPYYVKNGLTIAMTNTQVRDYGKYFRISLIIANNSVMPFDFDPDDMIAVLTDKRGQEIDVVVLSSDDYIRKVRRSQNWAMALNGLAEGMAAANAAANAIRAQAGYSGGAMMAEFLDNQGH